MTLSKPKHPWFTIDPLSTKSFGPGHVVGAGIIVFGTIVLAKGLIARHAAAVAARSPAGRVVLTENDRGQYGREDRRSP
jgi:hypothetical protein